MVVIGNDPMVSTAMAKLLQTTLSMPVRPLTLRQLDEAGDASVILAECKDEKLLQELRTHFPKARILARIPADHPSLWHTRYADAVIDRLAPYEMIVRSLRGLCS